MDPFLSDDRAILHHAAERARRLLDHLVRNQAELGATSETLLPSRPPRPPGPADDPSVNFPSPGLLAEGEAVLQRATESARRLGDDLLAAADWTDPSNLSPPPTPPFGA
jgi:hypothetical protein